MCDTFVATPASTAGGMLFGKNSDRQRNEAQVVDLIPEVGHSPHTQVACTYIAIPQVARTYATLLCRPFWLWGAEMGANECGVVIGNEGLHARSPAPEEPALTGMDLLRLALERASTASEAADLITRLLEQHGQGGNGGHLTPNYYNNGFLITDPKEAYVLETVGREWMLERVRSYRTLSNVYSIGEQVDRVSSGLDALVRNSGWNSQSELNYAEVIKNPGREHIGHAEARRSRSSSLLRAKERNCRAADLMRILRDHGTPHAASAGDASPITLCMHAGGPDRAGQTVGSLVSELHAAHHVHWVTATSAPCISLYKPVFLDAPLPFHGPRPTDRFDPRTLWWAHERMHRAALNADFERFLSEIQAERDALEDEFRQRVSDVLDGGSTDDRAQVAAECWKAATLTEQRWSRLTPGDVRPETTASGAEWARLSHLAGLA